ncbi:MAG: bacteriohemerythrin [Magnetococcales bacterium]|nr:bacteriohemerythrin [Magnetococcales bacterium]
MQSLLTIRVTAGVFWLKVPEAGLNILCGCPADVVKHLIRQGLISSAQKDGITFETGPNAILLSDVMLQNGDFANVAEFPVLQMLYKQGMILPNHPNNTGEKPMLIGASEQVNAQMRYIYRGNYGLVSREEIIQTGVDPEVADEMMRLKLRFAFGKIRPTTDLLDTRIVGDKGVEIKNGLFVRRLDSNIFEFEYQGHTATVDLNLKPGERYETAYPLGFRRIRREYFGVIHSGEGDGWDINRPSMSSVLMFQGKIYLIDAGPNLASNLVALGIGLNEIEGIFHTHAHDDHFAGITTLMQAGHKIKYFATPLVRATIEKKLAALLSMEEERFLDFFDVYDLDFDTWNDIDALEVKPLFSPHPLETSIFIFRTLWDGGYKTYAHFADIVSLDVLEGMVTDSTTAPGISQTVFDKVKSDYLTPVDIKKIDIGGGLIHGVAKDFREDRSDKILLSHTALQLSPEEMEIGSNAPYGITDILISGKSDLVRRSAFQFLESYFPNIPDSQIRILLNSFIVDFNPGSIILKEGETSSTVLLVLSGAVDCIRTRSHFLNQLSAGAMIGELSGLHGVPSESTYRAACFVRALRVPANLYIEIVMRNGLLPRIEQTWEVRSFLESTVLFGEGVSYPILNRILDFIEEKRFEPGESVGCKDLDALNVIKSGKLQRLIGSEVIDTLSDRDYFGEESAIFDSPCLFRIEVLEPTQVLRIPGEVLLDIPIVRWKLFESYQRRASKIILSGKDSEIFLWRESFSVQVSRMDVHHKKLVEIANSIMEIIRSDLDMGSMERALEALVNYTKYHFSEEESIMMQYGYPEAEAHKEKHAVLEKKVHQFRADLRAEKALSVAEFRAFFSDWLIQHILEEDVQYGVFLNEKCVF